MSVVARTPARQLPDWDGVISDQDTAAAVIHDTDMDFVILKVGWGPFFYWYLYNALSNVECSEQYKLGKHE